MGPPPNNPTTRCSMPGYEVERLSQNGDEVGLSTTYLQFVYQVNHERHHSTYKTLCLTKTF